MSTIGDVMTIGVPVTDQDRAVEFYVERFELHDQDGNRLEIVQGA
jgi:hypothetical protein